MRPDNCIFGSLFLSILLLTVGFYTSTFGFETISNFLILAGMTIGGIASVIGMGFVYAILAVISLAVTFWPITLILICFSN